MAGNIATSRATGKHFDFAVQLRDANRSQELKPLETEK
jgi:hypothetical protein